MSTPQKQPSKYVQTAEAVVWFAFVAFGGLAALSLLNFIELTAQFKAVVGYAIGAFTILVLGWLAFNAVKNK